jgi:hypothetical protein
MRLEVLLAIASLAEYSEEALDKSIDCLATEVLEHVLDKECRVLNDKDISDLRYELLKNLVDDSSLSLLIGRVWVIAYLLPD